MTQERRSGPRAQDLAAVTALPWPNVRGKRCLGIGTGGDLTSELERRGAAEVVALHLPAPGALELLDPAELGLFDVVVATGLLTSSPEPVAALRAAHGVTRGMLLSIEELDLWLSVLARGRPLLTFGEGTGFRFNGAAHKRALQAAGFAVERVSAPFVLREGGEDPPGWRRHLDAAATRLLTRSPEQGRLHRALLARAERR